MSGWAEYGGQAVHDLTDHMEVWSEAVSLVVLEVGVTSLVGGSA